MASERAIRFRPPASVWQGFQGLLLRLCFVPFMLTLGALLWLAFLTETPERHPWQDDLSWLWVTAVPLAWVIALSQANRQLRQLTHGLDAFMAGGQPRLPDDFAGLAHHLTGLHTSLQQQQDSAAAYGEALRTMDVQRSLLLQIVQEPAAEVDLEAWRTGLQAALQPTLSVIDLRLWIQEGTEFVPFPGPSPHASLSLRSAGDTRRSFPERDGCWEENGHYLVRVPPHNQPEGAGSGPELPRAVGLVLDLTLSAPLKNACEQLEEILPMVSVSWSNWTTYQELFVNSHIGRDVITTLNDAVLLVDRRGLVMSGNPACATTFGVPIAELHGIPLDNLLPLPPALGDSWLSLLRQRNSPPAYHGKVERPHQPPLAVDVHAYVAPGRFTVSGALALTVMLRDISRQEELEGLRSAFTATLSHELRTPLMSMKGYLQMLMHRKAREFDADKTQGIVALINSQADHLQRLIQELLEAARLRTEDLEIRPRPVELASLLRQAVDGRPKIQLTLNLQDPCWTMCDPDRITTTVDHLLSNAQKYSLPGGAVEVGCKNVKGRVHLWVRDEGVGIPLEHQDKIFDMYHRIDNGDRRTHYGVGLGLFLARRVAESHGGSIAVESSPGCGATFTLNLPATYAPLPANDSDAPLVLTETPATNSAPTSAAENAAVSPASDPADPA